MFKVTIKSNTRENAEWAGTFKTMDELNVWVEKQKLKDDRKPGEAVYTIQDVSKEYRLRELLDKRRKEYGSVESQLDMIYHEGVESWKKHIEKVKKENPKAEN